MPVFQIDGEPVEYEPGEKVLSAALRCGKIIPHYCYHPGMSIVATCRMCLVDVIDLGPNRLFCRCNCRNEDRNFQSKS